MDYPKVKYHKTLEPIVVSSAEDEAKLSKDWANSPADFGIITAPSVEQLAQMSIDEAKKLSDAADLASVEVQSPNKKSK